MKKVMARKKLGHAGLAEMRGLILTLRAQGWSLPRIGKAIGKHHATVLYHLECMRNPVSLPKDQAQYLVHRGAGL